MSRLAALGLCFALCALAQPTAAEDWLAVLQPPPAAGPGLELYYPRAELPAVVEAGDVLVVRLQLTAAMTPPPGVQQSRALAGFDALLRGDGLTIVAAHTHKHRLRVLSLRPDDGSSLLYRLRVRVPAFVAPGTYAFELTTPFGARAALRAVRVIAPGSEPRLAACPPAATELGTLRVDVWLCQEPAQRLPDAPGSLGLVAAPELHAGAGQGVFALRIARSLWRFGGDTGSTAFERELVGVSRLERRAIVAFGPAHMPPALPAAAFDPPRVMRTPHALELHSAVERRLLVLWPARRAAPGASALYPATDLRLREASTLAALWDVPADARVQLSFDERARRVDAPGALQAIPAHACSQAALRVMGAAGDARVAYEWADRTALGGPALEAQVEGPLEEPARALVMSRTTGAQLLRTQVLVDARRPPSCSLQQPPRSPGSTLIACLLLCSWASLLKIRRRRGVGNRIGPHVRCELRHGVTYPLPPRLDLPSALHCAVRVRADHDSEHARPGHARES